MNQRRSHIISKRPFAGGGLEHDSETWFERFQQFKQELENDIPSLRALKASVLKLSFGPSESGTLLIARLEESDQTSLVDQKNGSAIFDVFANDVRRVAEDQASIEFNIFLAQSPATNPFGNPAISNTRRRLRSALSQGDLTIWSAPHAKLMPLFECPKYIPNSPAAQCKFLILQLAPLGAQVELREDVHFSAPDDRVILRGTKLSLSRLNGHQSVASGSILQRAMDSRMDCKVEIAIVLFWEAGEISHLELISFSDEMAISA
jgi:hypothetical protein